MLSNQTVALLVVGFGFVWVLAWFGAAYVLRLRDHPFADRAAVDVVFRERGVSMKLGGDSFTRRGAANNFLTATVTPGELWIYGPDVMALVLDRCDLDHRIPLERVVDVRREGEQGVVVRFLVEGGGERTLTLRMKDAEGFVTAVAPSQYHRMCVIHLRAEHENREELESSLAKMLDARPAPGGLRAGWAWIEVNEKSALDREYCPEENFELEIIADDRVSTDLFKAELKRLLEALKAAGIGTVPACDFENELEGWEREL